MFIADFSRFFDILSIGAVGEPETARLLWRILLTILALNITEWIFYRIASFGNDYFKLRVMTNLLQTSYDYLQYHSYRFFTSSFVGSLVKKVTRLARAFESFEDKFFWNLLPLAYRIFGIVIVVGYYQSRIAMMLVVWIILFLILNYWFARWKFKYDEERARRDSVATGVLADAITNQTNIRLFTGFRHESKRFQDVTESVRRIRLFTWVLDNSIEAVQHLLMIVVEFALMAAATWYWRAGAVTLGTFVLIQTYLLQLFIRIWDFGRMVRELHENMADAKEMVEILLLPHEITDAVTAKPLTITDGTLEFRNVRFSYHQTRRVIYDFSIAIAPGEKVALIGPSGSGKTTIIKLLFRLYGIDGGKILIDGQKIHSVTQESLHAALSLVPQDPILFHRTLMENIRYGRREATDEEVIEAAKLAHCHEFIQDFPQQYGTFVGERGVKLSGGERQRVAIARAILRNAPILVLDEATSSLDSESEMMIQEALKRLMKGKTAIVIAHRLSTVSQMDRIIVLDKGRIVEEGTHKRLLGNRGSLYRKLWLLQSGGFMLDEEEEE